MGLDDIRLRETVDLAERAEGIRDDLVPELERRIEAAESAEEPEHTPDELRDLKDRLTGQATACDRVVDALDGDGEFVLQELMTAETALLTDDVGEQAVQIDMQRQQATAAPKEGFHKVRTLELSIIDAPDEMETQSDRDLGREVYKVGLLPDLVSDYLYECATALNDGQEVDEVQNLSSFGLESEET